jgi:hypothetical protein
MAANRIDIGNDSDLTLTGLRHGSTYLNAASVTCQPYNLATGSAVAVGSAVTLAYVAASSGNYAGVLESSVIDAGFAVDDPYRLDFAASEAGYNGAWSLEGVVGRRGGS